MISINSIEAYKASLVPTPETELPCKEIPADTKTFDPLGQGRGGWTASGFFDKIADAINRMCNSIQYHTDLRQHELEEERRWIEIESNETPSEATLKALYLAMDAARTMREEIHDHLYTPAENAYQWAKQATILRNPWELLENSLGEMAKSATCARGIVELFMDAEATRQAAAGLMKV